MSNAELATSYAALILADDGVDITVRVPPARGLTKLDGLQTGQDADYLHRPRSYTR
jgi:hypothetical protein